MGSMAEGVCALDRKGRITYANPAAEELLGWGEAEMIERDAHALVHSRPAGDAHGRDEGCALAGALRSGTTHTCDEDSFSRKDGSLFTVAYTASPIRADGEVSGAVLTFRDISERKRADEELAERARLSALSAEIGVALTQADTLRDVLQRCAEAIVSGLDAAFARVWTLNEAEGVLELQASAGMYTHLDGPHSRVPVGKFKIGLIAEERRPHLTNSVIGDPRVGDQEWASREGMVSFAGYPLIIDDRLVGVVAMFARHVLTDATLEAMAAVAKGIALGIVRKRAEEELAHQSNLTRTITDNAASCLFMMDKQGHPTFMNPAAVNVTGYHLDEIKDKPLHYAVHYKRPDGSHYPMEECPIDNASAELVKVSDQEEIFARKDGTLFPVSYSVSPLERDGQTFGAVLEFRDVTELKRAGEELKASEQRYRALTDAMPQLVWATDAEGRHLFFNQRWYEFTGMSEEESLGFGFADALHPDDRERTLGSWDRAWRTGETYDIEYRFFSRPLGEYRWFLGRAVPVRDEAGQAVQWVGTCTDIEEQKQMEELLGRLNEERERMLEEVSTPVVPVWRDVLILPLIGSLDTVRMERATHAALGEVTRTGARACIIDITGARIVDSHAVANLSNLVSALKLIGAEAMVTGVSRHAAQSLVGLGLDLQTMRTSRTLAEALAKIISGHAPGSGA